MVTDKVERNERILRGLPPKPVHMWLDQHNQSIWAHTVKELVAAHNARYGTNTHTVAKMYVDKKDERTVHCGHIIGRKWYRRYAPVEIEA